MESESPVLGMWSEIKALVEAMELDVVKNARGVAAAGVRARRGLRALKSKSSELVKLMVATDKQKKA